MYFTHWVDHTKTTHSQVHPPKPKYRNRDPVAR